MEKLRHMEKYLKNIENIRLMANILMILGILSTSISLVASLIISEYLNALFSLIPLIVSFILYSGVMDKKVALKLHKPLFYLPL